MQWKLFIDDERFPVTDDWSIARSSHEAIELITRQGMPTEIAFDHDLGGGDTAMRLCWWIIDQYYDGSLELPESFTFSVHSQNPIGAENIRSLMNGFLNDVRN